MAKRKKRINTGLVGFITAMAMMICVVLVGVLVITQASQDPAKIAEMAATVEQAGDLEQAATRYMQAYQVDREAEYVIEASRILLTMGRWQDAFATLQTAHRARPDDLAVVETLIENFWMISEFGVSPWRELKEYPSKVLGFWDREVEDIDYDLAFETLDRVESVELSEKMRGLCVISLANALTRLPSTNDRQMELAGKALEIAQTTNPNDPRVVSAVLQQTYDYTKLPADADERLEYLRDAQVNAIEVLNKARTAEPQAELDVLAVNVLSEEPIYGSFSELRRTDDSLALLREALQNFPDDSKLKTTFAQTVVRHIEANFAADTPLPVEESRELITEARSIIEAALEEDPAFYQGVDLLASIALAERDPQADEKADEIRRLQAAVAVYDTHRDEGVTAETLRAAFGGFARMRMLFNGFQRSITLRQLCEPDSEEQEEAQAAMGRFAEALDASYPESIEAQWVSGTYAQLNRELFKAIEKFSAAASSTERLDILRSRIKFDSNQQLARLFYNREQTGEAARYAEEAIRLATALGVRVSPDIQAMQLTIMIQMDNAQQALDITENLLRENPADELLNRVRAQALLALNRRDEARQSLEQSGDSFADLAKVRLAILERDFTTATGLLREYLKTNERNRDAIDLLVQAMTAAEMQDELTAFLDEEAARSDDQDYLRWLNSRKLFATIRDPNERLTALIKLIEEQPDPETRAVDIFAAYRQAGRLDKAKEALNEVEKYRPDNVAVLDQQFRFALLDEDMERAEEYARRLTEVNADNADGARYRSELAVVQGKIETALSELLIAESKLPPDSNLKAQIARTYLMFEPRRVNEAIGALEEALRLNPRHALSLRLLFLVKVEAGLSNEDPEYASLLRRAAGANPGDETLRPFLDRLSEQENPADAIASREKIMAETPDDADNILRLVQLYARPEVDEIGKAGNLLVNSEPVFAAIDLEDPEKSPVAWRYYRYVAEFFGSRRLGGDPQKVLDRLVEKAPATKAPEAELVRAQFYFLVGDQVKTLESYQSALAAADKLEDTAAREEQRITIQASLVRYQLSIGQLDEGLTLGEQVLSQLGDSNESAARAQALRLNMINALITTRPNDARRMLDRYQEDYPKDIRGRSLMAGLMIRQQQLSEALDVLTLLLRDDPRNAWALDARGGLNVEFSRFDDARRDLLAAKAESPWGLNLRPRYKLARLYELTGQPELAEAEYKEIIDEQPENFDAARQLVGFYRRTDQNDAAAQMLTRLSARYPNQPFWAHQLGILLGTLKNYSAAIRPLQTAAELTEWSRSAYIQDWGHYSLMADRADDVLATLKANADKIPPTAYTFVAAGAYSKLGRIDECKEAVLGTINSVIALDTRAVGELIRSLNRTVPLETLHEALSQKIADQSLSSEQQLNLRLVQFDLFIELGDLDAANRSLEELANSIDSNSPMYVALLTAEAKLIESMPSSTFQQKREIYEKLIETQPDNVAALNNLAYALAKADQVAEAQPYVERLRALEVEEPSVLDTIGLVFMLNGKLEEAQVQFQKALLEQPRAMEINLHLANLYQKKGDNQSATTQYRKTIDIAQEIQTRATLPAAKQMASDVISQARTGLEELQQ